MARTLYTLAHQRFCFIFRTVAFDRMMALRTSSGSDFIRTIFAASIATSVPAPMAMPMLHALFEVCRRQAPRSGGVPGSGIRLQRRLTTEGQADGAVRHEQDADVLRWRQAEVAGVRI